MKKLFAAIAAMSITVTASAASMGYIMPDNAKKGYFAAYDKNGRLCAVRAAVPDGNVVKVPDFGAADAASVKLLLDDGTVAEEVEIPDNAAEQMPVSGPVETDFPQRPAIYENDAQSFTATALVKNVRQVSVDNEIVTQLTLLWWGEEHELTVDNTIRIEGASDAYSELIGKDASVLKPGDVIIPAYIFKTAPKSIFMIYRPSKTAPAFDSLLGYYPLYTTEGYTGCGWRLGKDDIDYYFGIVTKSNSRYIELMQPNGLAAFAHEITINKDTLAYSYDISNLKSAEIAYSGSVPDSGVIKSNVDENGNVTFSGDEDFVYALVRTIDDVAAEVIYYEGY